MNFEFKYNSVDEMLELIKSNSDKYLVRCKGLDNGENIIIFTDIPPLDEVVKCVEKKISILEAENKILKQELSITQDAINELIFNSLNM